MKLCKLKLKNLNSFSREIEVDFENPPLGDASLVAITGPTGAGKTTLLDAICVALYGKTPRLRGAGNRNPNHLISHGEKEAFSEVEFLVNGVRYIAAWTIKRGYSPNVRLINAEDNQLISDKLSKKGKSLGVDQNTVNEEVTALLGLDFDVFERSVMLAQGEFAAFLKASKEDRRNILEATARIAIYDVLRQTLIEKVKEVTEAYNEVQNRREQIPESSPEQIAEKVAERKLLKAEVEKLKIEKKQIHEEKERETRRKEDYEKLKSSEARKRELIDQQPRFDAQKLELKHAERANQLRVEKHVYDIVKSDLENTSTTLQLAAAELGDVKKQVKTHQNELDEKEKTYIAASSERDEKVKIYTVAKSDIGRATEQFAEVRRRNPALESLNQQIDTSSSQLREKETRQGELLRQIADAQTFLDENQLPSDRHQRLNQTDTLRAQLNLRQQQQEGKINDRLECKTQIGELEENLKQRSEDRETLFLKAEKAETDVKKAKEKCSALQDTGTLEEWQHRRDNARKAQPIAQQYEMSYRQLRNEESSLEKLQKHIGELDKSLNDLEKKFKVQSQLCNRAEAKVEKLESDKRSVQLASPVNQLKQQLEEGKPCRVCGSTEHPDAHKLELENNELIENIQQTLDNAEKTASEEERKKRNMEQKQVRFQQDKDNTTAQIETCKTEMESLITQIDGQYNKWQEIYESTDISSEWVTERIEESDTTIDNLNSTHEKYNEEINQSKQISHELTICEDNLKEKDELLKETKQKLDSVTDEIEDLKSVIANTEESFWETIPDVFHGVALDQVVTQFEAKITEVASHENELNTKNNQLTLLNVEIENNQSEITSLTKNLTGSRNEIQHYQKEGGQLLASVREKTDGLETIDEINKAIDRLDTELQMKKDERDDAQQRLQERQQLLAQKQAAHEISVRQHGKSIEKFDEAKGEYYAQLDEVGFNSPEIHNQAFRDDTQIQELTENIDVYEDEKHQLEETIDVLKVQFLETPYDSEVLTQIVSKAEEIEAQIQEKQQGIGAQQQIIDALKDAHRKREELGDELSAAKHEMERWKGLQETIPANVLRDFALEIIFKQMVTFANAQLYNLTTERYQLRSESIGDLVVIDRWNANEERPVETLSGGESFLTSLALALALSEISQGRTRLNSLFLDEGFGTLDAETLDIAIAALEGLRTQGRSIYLISHIQELTRRLPAKINVKKRGNGSSYIEIRD